MSHIRFHLPDDRYADLRGIERHWMGQVCTKVALSVLNLWDMPDDPSWTRRLLSAGHYIQTARDYERTFKTWLSVGGEGMLHPVTGKPVNAFAVILNTALALGSDEVKLMARLHGQCELHAYIPPKDALFVMRLIESGLKRGIFREDMGWEKVWRELQGCSVTGDALVTSYSVTDSFPPYEPETEERKDWAASLTALDKTLAITEEGFRAFYFGDGETLMSLEKAAKEAK